MFTPALYLLSLLAARSLATTLPSYVLRYAPLSYLDSGETYWPTDISDFFTHVTPKINGTAVGPSPTVNDLAQYSSAVFLTSNDDVTNTDQPQEPWLLSAYNKPDASGLSPAPATIIAVQKPGGIVDAFYFYFYAYNLGKTFAGVRFDDHVGDWEHTMIRFVNGAPSAMYFSQHSWGSAYTWPAVSKAASGRPYNYIATGDHANYPTTGNQPYPSPIIGPIMDTTNKGTLWDVTLNFRGYLYDTASSTFSAAGGAGIGGSEQAGENASWLMFGGAWGDDTPPTDILKNEQYCVFGECHYAAGPTGPEAKDLARSGVCPDGDSQCSVKTSTSKLHFRDLDSHLATIGDALRGAQSRGLLE